MDPQVQTKEAWSNPLEFVLYESDDQGGYVKTQNVPADRTQRREVTARGNESKFRVQVTLRTCLHGFLDDTESTPATLIVLDAQFVVVNSNKARFKSAELKLEFTNGKQGEGLSPPEVVAFAPFRTPERMNMTFDDRGSKVSLGGSLGIQALATAELRTDWERQSWYTQRYFDRGSAGTGYNPEHDCMNSVWWALQESGNPHEKHGISPFCRFAVLLKRSSQEPFEAKFSLKLDAATGFDLFDAWSFRKCQTVVDDPLKFSPFAEPQGEFQGLDAKNLGKLAADEALVALTAVPGLEPLHRAI